MVSTRKASDIQEKRGNKLIGANMVIGSGSTPFMKGDGKTTDLFLEYKTKMEKSQSISVKKEWFEKAKRQAWTMGRFMYSVAFSFGDGNDYFSMEDEQFKIMYEGYQQQLAIVELLDDMDGDDYKDIVSGIRKILGLKEI